MRWPNGYILSVNATIVTHSLCFPLDVIIRTTCLNVRFPSSSSVISLLVSIYPLPSLSSSFPRRSSHSLFLRRRYHNRTSTVTPASLRWFRDSYVSKPREAWQLLNQRSDLSFIPLLFTRIFFTTLRRDLE